MQILIIMRRYFFIVESKQIRIIDADDKNQQGI